MANRQHERHDFRQVYGTPRVRIILRGRLDEAESHLALADQLASAAGEEHALLYVDIVRVVLRLAQAQAGVALEDDETSRLAEAVHKSARSQGIKSDICRSEWLLGLVAMSRAKEDAGRQSQHMEVAWPWFSRARNKSDRMNLIHMETELDIGCAWHCAARGDYAKSLTYAVAAQRSAVRCDAGPRKAEALLLQGISRRQGEPEAAREIFEQAAVEARCRDSENRIYSVCQGLQRVSP